MNNRNVSHWAQKEPQLTAETQLKAIILDLYIVGIYKIQYISQVYSVYIVIWIHCERNLLLGPLVITPKPQPKGLNHLNLKAEIEPVS